MIVFFQALLIGLAIAIPIDEMYFLCIKKTLDRGIKAAFLIGLGTAIGDCTLVLLPILDIPCITHFFNTQMPFIKGASGLFLIFIGLREFRRESTYFFDIPHSTDVSLIFKSYFMEITNPVDIAVLLNLYNSIRSNSLFESIQIMLGVFMSVLAWWIFLGFIISRYKYLLPEKVLHFIKFLTSFALIFIGIIIIYFS